MTKVVLAMALGAMVSLLCELGDSAAAIHVVRLCASHVEGKVSTKMYDYILKHSKEPMQ